MEIILKNTTTEPASPTSWTQYTQEGTGSIFKFRGGAEAWTWEIKVTCPILQANQRKIINTYVNQGIKQHEYKGGFKEAVSTLKIKIK